MSEMYNVIKSLLGDVTLWRQYEPSKEVSLAAKSQ